MRARHRVRCFFGVFTVGFFNVTVLLDTELGPAVDTAIVLPVFVAALALVTAAVGVLVVGGRQIVHKLLHGLFGHASEAGGPQNETDKAGTPRGLVLGAHGGVGEVLG